LFGFAGGWAFGIMSLELETVSLQPAGNNKAGGRSAKRINHRCLGDSAGRFRPYELAGRGHIQIYLDHDPGLLVVINSYLDVLRLLFRPSKKPGAGRNGGRETTAITWRGLLSGRDARDPDSAGAGRREMAGRDVQPADLSAFIFRVLGIRGPVADRILSGATTEEKQGQEGCEENGSHEEVRSKNSAAYAQRAKPSGTYVVRLETESGVEMSKVMLIG
jgi:hypothetical protein